MSREPKRLFPEELEEIRDWLKHAATSYATKHVIPKLRSHISAIEAELKTGADHAARLHEVLSDYRECGESALETVRRLLGEDEGEPDCPDDCTEHRTCAGASGTEETELSAALKEVETLKADLKARAKPLAVNSYGVPGDEHKRVKAERDAALLANIEVAKYNGGLATDLLDIEDRCNAALKEVETLKTQVREIGIFIENALQAFAETQRTHLIRAQLMADVLFAAQSHLSTDTPEQAPNPWLHRCDRCGAEGNYSTVPGRCGLVTYTVNPDGHVDRGCDGIMKPVCTDTPEGE